MSSNDLRARMRAVFSARHSKNEKPVLWCYRPDFATQNGVTSGSTCNTAFPRKNKAITHAHRFSANKGGLKENTLCSVCGAGSDLWQHGDVLVHQECARLLQKPDGDPDLAYQQVSAEPNGSGCRVTIVEVPAKGLRYRRTFAALQLKPPALVEIARWRQCVQDGSKFLARWGEQAEGFGWSSAALFGLHEVPEGPHPSYRRLSRYGQAGLVWLLQGREVIALTETTASIRNPATGTLTTYRRWP